MLAVVNLVARTHIAHTQLTRPMCLGNLNMLVLAQQ